MDTNQIKRVMEAALLSAAEPLAMSDLRRLFDNELDGALLTKLLDELAADFSDRAVELVRVSSGWRFQTRPDLSGYLDRLTPEKAPRYSRAVMETLAIIAYRQPVTRGDIEEIRGVSVSSQIVRTLEERGWIDVIGHKDVIGRPALLGTTDQFLDDVGLRSLKELPPIDEMGPNEQTIEMFGQNLVEVVAPESAAEPAGHADADADADDNEGDLAADGAGPLDSADSDRGAAPDNPAANPIDLASETDESASDTTVTGSADQATPAADDDLPDETESDLQEPVGSR